MSRDISETLYYPTHKPFTDLTGTVSCGFTLLEPFSRKKNVSVWRYKARCNNCGKTDIVIFNTRRTDCGCVTNHGVRFETRRTDAEEAARRQRFNRTNVCFKLGEECRRYSKMLSEVFISNEVFPTCYNKSGCYKGYF